MIIKDRRTTQKKEEDKIGRIPMEPTKKAGMKMESSFLSAKLYSGARSSPPLAIEAGNFELCFLEDVHELELGSTERYCIRDSSL
jgi:hypothetical protein